MTEFIIGVGFIACMAGMIAASVWGTKKQCEEERLRSKVIFALYEEIKRYNDNNFSDGN